MVHLNSAQIATDQQAWWFVIKNNNILHIEGQYRIPFGTIDELPFPAMEDYTLVNIGEYQGSSCYLVYGLSEQCDFNIGEFLSLRSMLGLPEELFMLCGRAWQMANFIHTHQFCGRCGEAMELVDWELASHCNHCNHRCYPRISPSIIVAIRKENQLLLARSSRHAEGYYSILAGFVETGETLEQAVSREVMEEVGIKIKNIRYISSQPWPFPHSLMIGYLADYDSGEINIDDDEIIEAQWFDFDKLPQTPPKVSIAGQLIELIQEQ